MDDTAFVLVLHVDGLDIPVEVSRKRVKNLNLRIRSNGTIALSIPQRLPLPRAQEFLNQKASWIAARVRRAQARAGRMDPVAIPPEHIPLWGELVPRDVALARQGLHASQGSMADRGNAAGGGSAADRGNAAGRGSTAGQNRSASQHVAVDRDSSPSYADIDELYRAEVRRALPGVAARLESRMGVHAARWSVRTMKTRWGSCTPATRAIRINGRLAAYPPECLEFVVAHELVHLLEPSHNARFHALLDEFCPGNQRIARMLKHAPSP